MESSLLLYQECTPHTQQGVFYQVPHGNLVFESLCVSCIVEHLHCGTAASLCLSDAPALSSCWCQVDFFTVNPIPIETHTLAGKHFHLLCTVLYIPKVNKAWSSFTLSMRPPSSSG